MLRIIGSLTSIILKLSLIGLVLITGGFIDLIDLDDMIE